MAKGISLTVNITETELFSDIIALIKKHGEDNSEMMSELTEIMNKHSTDHEYSLNMGTPCEICEPKKSPICTMECQEVCPECKHKNKLKSIPKSALGL